MQYATVLFPLMENKKNIWTNTNCLSQIEFQNMICFVLSAWRLKEKKKTAKLSAATV